MSYHELRSTSCALPLGRRNFPALPDVNDEERWSDDLLPENVNVKERGNLDDASSYDTHILLAKE